jgi:cysteine desulfurase/selenocysteine lyase
MNAPAAVATTFDPARIRAEFPILASEINKRPLVYLDNAATTQKPRCVIDRLRQFYEGENANVHRGVHTLSRLASDGYEAARDAAREFLNAADRAEIIFTRGATEAINLVAHSFGSINIRAGDEILITAMEHHSNIVPWQLLAQQVGATLRVAPVDDTGTLDRQAFRTLLNTRTRLVGIVQVSNALGTINPVAELIAEAHAIGARVLIDGAQAVAHVPVDVRALDCDFYVFSGHKIFGPTGIGVLYGKRELLEAMPPYQTGGDMIKVVRFDRTEFNDLPYKFEAGTPHIAGAIGLGTALRWFRALDLSSVAAHEDELLRDATARLTAIPGLRLIGTAPEKCGVLTFVIDGAHPHDVGALLDGFGVAIRTGHHCAMPVMERFGVAGAARASLALYNTREDLDRFERALHDILRMLR